MRPEDLTGPDREQWLSKPEAELRTLLEELHPEDLAQALNVIEEPDDVTRIMRALSVEMSAQVMERLSSDRQGDVLESVHKDQAVEILSEMAPDDRADLVQELPADQRETLLEHLRETAPQIAEEVHELSSYGEDTAGGLMTTEFVALQPSMRVEGAINEVRRASKREETEHIYYVYVLYGDKLVGVVSLRQLLLSEPDKRLEEIMETNVVRLAPTEDQEKVAVQIAKYDLSALPVVDDQGNMLGVVTVDDVVDVVIEEATEDAQRMGGVMPLEDSYLQTSFLTFIRKRVGWLVVLFLGEMLTATVMERHNIHAIAGLSVFVPLIIATGGNSGSQSSSLIIRALAVGEVRPRDWWRVLGRELGIGLVLGLA
ncbi:MAG: magnesium transporter, partial [Myxococcales bacterium]|nr:magnesium transporter [Myxococcales bacterium]